MPSQKSHLQALVTAEEFAAVVAAAKANRRSVSSFVGEIVVDYLRKWKYLKRGESGSRELR